MPILHIVCTTSAQPGGRCQVKMLEYSDLLHNFDFRLKHGTMNGPSAELIIVDKENHMITKRLRKTVAHAVGFFAELFKD